MDNPPIMRGWTFTKRGKPSDVLTLTSTLPKPHPSTLEPNEILVKVSHVGIFQGFAAIMGIVPHLTSNPWIPGSDFSGVVEATGSSVASLRVGDAVFGSPDPKAYVSGKYNGMLVEWAVIPAGQAVRKPEWMGFDVAAGLGGNGCTAVQFVERTGLRRGMRVLVTGASGSLGSLMVQLARSVVGSEGSVVGTCSAANGELVRGLGADEVIDYRSHPRLHEYLAERYSSDPFDVIYDIAGFDDLLYQKSPAYLKADGTFLFGGRMAVTHGSGKFLDVLAFIFSTTFQTRWPRMLGGTPRRGVFHSGNINPESLQKVSRLVEDRQMKSIVDSEWQMEDAIKAYERVATGRGRGKVVVQVQSV